MPASASIAAHEIGRQSHKENINLYAARCAIAATQFARKIP
jgi:hypothetical protein